MGCLRSDEYTRKRLRKTLSCRLSCGHVTWTSRGWRGKCTGCGHHCTVFLHLGGVIQVLRNALGVSNFPGKSVIKVYNSTLLALRGGGWMSNFQEKNVTLHLNGPLYGHYILIAHCSARTYWLFILKQVHHAALVGFQPLANTTDWVCCLVLYDIMAITPTESNFQGWGRGAHM